jgi:hypothetical protein
LSISLIPLPPTLAATCDTTGNAYGVAVSGTYAYVADGNSGLQIIDISNPLNPTLTATYDTAGMAYGVAVSGNYAYVADYAAGVQMIDITDPVHPTLAGTYNTPGTARGVAVIGDYTYVADSNSGLQIIESTVSPAPGAFSAASDTVSVSVADITPPAITLSDSNTTVSEGGATDTFTVVLDTQPTANVVITLNNTNGQVTTDVASLTFTTANWDTPQNRHRHRC